MAPRANAYDSFAISSRVSERNLDDGGGRRIRI